MIRTIVFSKNRPLQLQAYLESFYYHAPHPRLKKLPVTAICHQVDKLLASRFPSVDWVQESTFEEAVRGTIANCQEDYILFGCDDVIWFRSWDIGSPLNALNHPDVLGFSLRLGLNVEGSHRVINTAEPWIWSWKTAPRNTHWGYPFEVMGTVYRKDTVELVLDQCPELRYPGDLEIYGVGIEFDEPYLSMPTLSCCAAHDVNRVQNYCGEIMAIEDCYKPEMLTEQFYAGYSLDWHASARITPSQPFLGDNGWKLKT